MRLPAFAKINLCLHVLGRRPDGYHELRTIFQAISLHDTLELSLVPDPGIIRSKRTIPHCRAGRKILCYRAIDAIGCEIGFRGGVRAQLEKRIPVARGLGGGSSDAAAALIGMLRLTEKKCAASPADGNRRGPGRRRAIFSFRRPRPGGESRR